MPLGLDPQICGIRAEKWNAKFQGKLFDISYQPKIPNDLKYFVPDWLSASITLETEQWKSEELIK